MCISEHLRLSDDDIRAIDAYVRGAFQGLGPSHPKNPVEEWPGEGLE